MTHFYRRQPLRGTKVAGNSPLGRGIGAHFLFNGNFESSVRNKPANPVVTSGPVFKSDRNGQYAVGTGAGKVTTSLYAKDLGVDGSRARTFIAEFYMGDNNVPRALFSIGDASTNARSQTTLEINSNYRQVRFDTFGTDLTYSPHSVTGTGARVWLAITYDGGTTVTFRSYSKLDSTGQVILNNQVSSTGSPLATGTTFPLTLMGGGTYGFASMISELYLLSIYGGRCLSSVEIDRLYADKHQVMAPPARFPYGALASASLTGYVMSAAPGAFGMSGAAAGLRVARRLPVAAASFSVSAAAAGLIATRRLPVSPGSFSVGASAARLLAARRLAAGAGAFTVTGQAAALVAARRLVAGPGAFALTGSSLQMVYTPAQAPAGPTYTLGVAPSSFVLAGSQAAIRFSRRLQAAPGAFGLAGGAAALRTARQLRVDSAAFVMAGRAAVLRYSSSAGPIDVSQISAAHIAVFDGSGSRMAVFDGTGSRVAVFSGTGARTVINGMTMKLPTLVNGKMTTDRDPDEISWYGADITQELIDRATTPDASKLTMDLSGVAVSTAPGSGPMIQTATSGGVTRTYVVVLLVGVDGTLPTDWRWTARVSCTNGERFDKTTYFNRVDT
jgi:hypothetical protein